MLFDLLSLLQRSPRAQFKHSWLLITTCAPPDALGNRQSIVARLVVEVADGGLPLEKVSLSLDAGRLFERGKLFLRRRR